MVLQLCPDTLSDPVADNRASNIGIEAAAVS
jgi:hypothetical protein